MFNHVLQAIDRLCSWVLQSWESNTESCVCIIRLDETSHGRLHDLGARMSNVGAIITTMNKTMRTKTTPLDRITYP